jgi:ribosomal protein L11 methylase PrmA
VAVRTAREHAAVNGAAVTYTTGDLAAVPAQGDIVVANVLAVVLAAEAAAVAAAVRDAPGHALLLSGILDSQYPDVAARYAARGFREVKSLLVGEWRSGWFARG